MAMAEVLPTAQLDALAAQLPPETTVYLRRTGSQPDPLFDSHLFVGWVVAKRAAPGSRDKRAGALALTAAYSGEEAVRRMRCVFSALKRRIGPDQQRELVGLLPEEGEVWVLN